MPDEPRSQLPLPLAEPNGSALQAAAPSSASATPSTDPLPDDIARLAAVASTMATHTGVKSDVDRQSSRTPPGIAPDSAKQEALDGAARSVGAEPGTEDVRIAERSLRESELLYRTLGEAVPDFVWACDAAGKGLFANRRWMEYTGLSLDEASRVPMDVFHHPDDYPRLVETWRTALRDRAAYSIEVRVRRHDGVYRWFLARAVPVKDENGRVTQWIGTTTDIHERRMAEDALRQSEAHYRQLIDAMPQLAWMTTADGEPEYFNRGWYLYTGTTAEQMLGNSRPELVHPLDAEQTAALWRNALASGESYDAEHRLRSSDGSYRWFLARGVPLKDDQGRIVRWFGTSTDIDTQKRAAQKEHFLAESSAALASSLDYETTLATVAQLAVPHLADWCVVHIREADGTIRRLAPAHTDPEKVKWAEDLYFRYPHDPDAPRGVANVLRTGKSESYFDITDEMLAADARDEEHLRLMREVGFTSLVMAPMIARGQVLGAITFVSAESGRAYEPADIAIAEDLAHSAALAVDNARSFRAAQQEIDRRQETERQLRLHQEEIEALNARLRLSVEATHHHVRNNLQTILALTQLPVQEGSDTVPVSALGRIGHHTSSLAAIHDLLTQQARTDANIDSLSARTAVEKLVPLLEATSRGRDIHYEAEDIIMRVQEVGSLCILINELITNAIQHGSGAVRLTITAQHGIARLEVCDDGCGFPADFDWREAAGTGLCLIDVAGRHDLRGRVDYLNRPEGGARVVVEFPVADAAV